ncbi:hypothetical protein PIB30_020120 [Stylosanthes scabra]|uniref:Uncharacterized protein n=1 Tax=Stylosanthes scabra TaxID=79078 RepID=A0ABU6X6Q6_9FABA|nr:hypothetical protein [Stylosanthes scabra]
MAERSIKEIAAEDRREMYHLNEVSHVAHSVHNESYALRRGAGRPRRGGRAGRGRGEGGDAAPTQQTQGGASTSQAVEEAGTSSQAYLPSTPQTQGTMILSIMSSM